MTSAAESLVNPSWRSIVQPSSLGPEGGAKAGSPLAALARAPLPRHPNQRLLAIIDAESNGEVVVRWTQNRARHLNAHWIVLYVESSRNPAAAKEAQLTRHLELARDLGAEVITAADEDPINCALRIAGQRDVSEIVVGRPPANRWRSLLKRDFAMRLLRGTDGITVHAVPVPPADGKTSSTRRTRRPLAQSTFPQYLLAIGVVAAVSVAAFIFTPLVGAHATALVLLLVVVLLALVVERGPALVAAALSALSWDFFFLPPVFEFRVIHFEDAMLLGMYFVVALVLGQYTARIRAQEESERRREQRATALYLLTRELSQAGTVEQLVRGVVRHLELAFDSPVAFLIPGPGDQLYTHSDSTLKLDLSGGELSSLLQVLSGKPNDPVSANDVLFFPLGVSKPLLAVIGLRLRGPLSVHRQNLLNAFWQQITLALERVRLSEISDRARLLAESERLSKTLLDSMSHEIRTPIAAITSAAGNLAELPEFGVPSLQREMIREIEQATQRLNRVVGNVLEASRLECGNVRPRRNECDVAELVHVAVAETERELSHHRLNVFLSDDLPLVRMDFVLMQQVLTNLLSNAANHTPPGTAIELRAKVLEGHLKLIIADSGPGIPRESLELVFNKFYRAPNAPTGGTGLGLSLVRGFVEAHGGTVTASNAEGSGAVFTVSLPLSEMASTGR